MTNQLTRAHVMCHVNQWGIPSVLFRRFTFWGGCLGIGDGDVIWGFWVGCRPETGGQLGLQEQTKRFLARAGAHGPLGVPVYVLAIPPSILWQDSYLYE